MKTLFVILLSALLAAPASAELVIENAYVRGLPPGVTATSAYMILRNTGTEPLELTGVSSPAAGSVMLHGQMEHGGMLHMMPLQSLSIPAGGELRLETRGSHIMLVDLVQALVPGAAVELTLEFADGQTRTVTAPVRSVLDE